MTIVVQVNGKLRGKFDSPVGLDRAQLVERARVLDNVRSYLADAAEIVRVIVVPDKLVNFVVRTA